VAKDSEAGQNDLQKAFQIQNKSIKAGVGQQRELCIPRPDRSFHEVLKGRFVSKNAKTGGESP